VGSRRGIGKTVQRTSGPAQNLQTSQSTKISTIGTSIKQRGVSAHADSKGKNIYALGNDASLTSFPNHG